VELVTNELGFFTFGVALGVVWCGLLSLKKVRCGVVWFFWIGVRCGVVWFGKFRNTPGVVWCGLVNLETRQVWCGVVWQNISKKVWCGVVWHLKRPTMISRLTELSEQHDHPEQARLIKIPSNI
jgi:hypothetical protein